MSENGETAVMPVNEAAAGSAESGAEQESTADVAQAEAPQQRMSWFEIVRQMAIQLVIFWSIQGLFNGNFLGSPSSQNITAGNVTMPPANLSGGAYYPLLTFGDQLSLQIFVSEESDFSTAQRASAQPTWALPKLQYGDWTAGPEKDGVFSIDLQQDMAPLLANNGSLYVHASLQRVACSTTTARERCTPAELRFTDRLIRFFPPPTASTKHNLLSGAPATEVVSTPAATTDHEKALWIPYWHENITVALLTDQTPLHPRQLTPELTSLVSFNESSHTFAPTFHVDRFWELSTDRYPLNTTTPTVPLRLRFVPVSLLRWQFQAQMQKSFDMQTAFGTSTEAQSESMKRMFIETNPWYLGLTMVVSLLHTIFDCLAFKNDIQFWQQRKSMEGLSLRAILISLATQVIIFLYLLDREASWMVVISSGVGLLIQAWKITKASDVEIRYVRGILPYPVLHDKADYASTTRKYDELAWKYLSWVLYPCLGGYAIYSLVYEEHKGLYSFTVGVLAGAVYVFGFITQTPQLFINYKLQSVAHMPWRMMIYRFLNTIIDDLFAFIIHMPTAHRIACFRDDIIFLIYLYQRWIYRVDHSRKGDYDTGEGGEEPSSTTPAVPASSAPRALPAAEKKAQ
ncbi:uncharacterized protein MONBRDRAFT_28710 [Monosiga brevicollis MX1]|uniref:Cleft lip and palate associated transmembrane protein n=1 Tax=Monosiga brevicollis TaxID=81824 RepID=A9V8Z0_MONBE|nr:uncharacterized protein MONBRDRAFT_28710 [Monosiga brevicollis MX1]EDQ85960.1 predicted protein [Monosiga brevicollis MX1]|eukprot:XP_001749154.1 hypothetical protein [Monosiga brevicollis MX1]